MTPSEALNEYLAATGRPHFVFFGPHANCTFELCSTAWSAYGYRPDLGANIALLVTFIVALLAHVVLGVWWRQWYFMACMICGCLDEILGYAARVWMYYDLWSFKAFMIQAVCITTAPVFYCAAIYVVLARTISISAPTLSRPSPALLYRLFIPCDLASLVLQAVGGGISASSAGLNTTGIRVALTGLALQVATLVLFCAACADFARRHHRATHGHGAHHHHDARRFPAAGGPCRLRLFFAAEALAVVAILARCAFRVDELSLGYAGPLVKREDLFIGLEGVLIVVAAFALCIGHPGLISNVGERRPSSEGLTSTEVVHEK